MFATSAVALALAAAVVYAQDLSIQTPPLAQASAIPIVLVSSSARPIGLQSNVLTVREFCNQLLWRLWSLLCRQCVPRLRDAADANPCSAPQFSRVKIPATTTPCESVDPSLQGTD